MHHTGSENFELLKIQAYGRHLEKSKMAICREQLDHRHEIWHGDAYCPSAPNRQLKFRTFKN